MTNEKLREALERCASTIESHDRQGSLDGLPGIVAVAQVIRDLIAALSSPAVQSEPSGDDVERVVEVIREWLLSTDYPVSQWERDFAKAVLSAMSSREAGLREPQSYAEWQQRRGMLPDTVDWAILEYDNYMADDAYDPQAVLDRIVARLRSARDALNAGGDRG